MRSQGVRRLIGAVPHSSTLAKPKRSDLLRLLKPVTWVRGPQFRTDPELIEIDVTYACNLRCANCNRSCTQAPDGRYMKLHQIERLLAETIQNGRTWKRIRVVGGEPFIHPQIIEILERLVEFRDERSPSTRLEITTNGYGDRVNRNIEKAPAGFVINNSRKKSAVQEKFEPFNLAPCDLPAYFFTDFTNACRITSECGMGLSEYGYYQCAVAAGIDRVMGCDIGLKSLPSVDDQMMRQKRRLCRYCGHYLSRKHLKSRYRQSLPGEVISKSWQKAYERYDAKKPSLSSY